MKMESIEANTRWSIVPDCGGLIDRFAVSLPNKVFDSENPHAAKILTAIGNLLQAMPPAVSILVFTDACNEAAAETWLNQQTSCHHEIILAKGAPLKSADIWAQDSILVQAHGNELRLGAPKCDWPDGTLPSLLADHLSVACHDLPLFLPGGDQIVGEDFRLIGQTSRLRSAASKFGGDGTLLEADRRINQLDHRPVCYWGYRRNDLTEKPSVLLRNTSSDNETAFDHDRKEDLVVSHTVLQRALQLTQLRPDLVTRIERCESHVDRYVSPTGLRLNGKNLLLLADPVAVAPEAASKAKREKRLLDASEHWLRDQGFEIIRNPVPFGTDVKNAVRPRLYNNILLENAIREGNDKPMMWLPCFGDDERFTEYDLENSRIWKDLGFEPRHVNGWESLAHANGALRCASKVISRLP
ncbi:hypothetical protein FMN63_25775 [Stappia sp. BW2]|uniref:hypothetical protein n=1 Tax=Stappia sp. BW2 TaxID=2592622 RepID=UPI0011DEE8D8|nr:hypothetical protein [Stappia sp. BW2]TYC65778.1 hypothetical protein FMN63_25775 [Stappia sp. BW2]